jgi:hypothetical protein
MTTLVEELTQLGTMQALKPPVHILDDYGNVDKDLVRINRGIGEQVEWINNGKNDAQIVFEDSPFAPQQVFHVPAGKSTRSGPPTKPHGIKHYKYTVVGSKGNYDPVVIIDP